MLLVQLNVTLHVPKALMVKLGRRNVMIARQERKQNKELRFASLARQEHFQVFVLALARTVAQERLASEVLLRVIFATKGTTHHQSLQVV